MVIAHVFLPMKTRSETRVSATGRRGGQASLRFAAPQSLSSNDAKQGIRAAIVHGAETVAAADEIETLLGRADGFTCVRFQYQTGAAIKSGRFQQSRGGNLDLVVAALGRSQADDLDGVFAWFDRVFPHLAVVAVPIATASVDAYQILQAGATDFVLPPLRSSELLPRVRRQARVNPSGDDAIKKLKEEIGLKHIVGESPRFLTEVRRIARFANCDAPVLISGESGTGKEIFARALHYLSPRADAPFMPVNCGALPEHLMESEIFGHKRGAFTGATVDQAGLVAEAEGGTVFLDEIDSLSPAAQVKLLRFLQDGEYRAVGSQKIAHANIRIIAATNTESLLQTGKFREDLFYRLNVLPLTLPPLRERHGDILLLTHHFLERHAAEAGQHPKDLSLAALNALMAHLWPGNVRELQNILTRAAVLSDHGTIELSDLGLPDDSVDGEIQSFREMKARVVSRFEHDFLKSLLRTYEGNITRAASATKMNRRAFWELLRKHGLHSKKRR